MHRSARDPSAATPCIDTMNLVLDILPRLSHLRARIPYPLGRPRIHLVLLELRDHHLYRPLSLRALDPPLKHHRPALILLPLSMVNM
ncbi:MAG: hypothetical protein L6R40_002251 [Gallowayella cf. fulva]|nr:MAG: hypothetical protein L6R40_002251 [Xanthomendoza cf. fulva]